MVEEVEEVAQRVVVPPCSLEYQLGVMTRQDPQRSHQTDKRRGHPRRSVTLSRRFQILDRARRKTQRDVAAKSYHLVVRTRLTSDRFAFGIDQFKQAHRLEKIKAKSLLEKDFA